MRLLIVIVLGVLGLPVSGTAADIVHLKTEEYRPFQYLENGRLTGVSVEIVQELQRRVGNTADIEIGPWIRGFKLTKNRDDHGLFSVLRTPAREPLFQWVGPLAGFSFYFYRRKGEFPELKTVEDARKVGLIGVTRYTGNESLLKGLGFTNLSVAANDEGYKKNIELLVKRRIDLWLVDRYSGGYFSRMYGYERLIEPITALPLDGGELYMAFGQKVDSSSVARWQEVLDQMRDEGYLQAIYQKYGL